MHASYELSMMHVGVPMLYASTLLPCSMGMRYSLSPCRQPCHHQLVLCLAMAAQAAKGMQELLCRIVAVTIIDI